MGQILHELVNVKENKKICQNLWAVAKAMYRERFIVLNSSIKKEERSQCSQLQS